MTTKVKLAIVGGFSIRITCTSTSTPEDLDHEVELITQSPLEVNVANLPTLMKLETDPQKRNVPTSSKNTSTLPNVTHTKTIRLQLNHSLDGVHKRFRKKNKNRLRS